MPCVVPEVDLQDWGLRLAAKYPQVKEVWLCGSRAKGWHVEKSDYNICLVLNDECYDTQTHEQKEQIEQRIAFDSEFLFYGLDLLFLRLRGDLGRWEYGPGDVPQWILDVQDEYVRDCLVHGCPHGDFSRFYNDMKFAQCLCVDGRPAPASPGHPADGACGINDLLTAEVATILLHFGQLPASVQRKLAAEFGQCLCVDGQAAPAPPERPADGACGIDDRLTAEVGVIVLRFVQLPPSVQHQLAADLSSGKALRAEYLAWLDQSLSAILQNRSARPVVPRFFAVKSDAESNIRPLDSSDE
jgi:hypothetical protein